MENFLVVLVQDSMDIQDGMDTQISLNERLIQVGKVSRPNKSKNKSQTQVYQRLYSLKGLDLNQRNLYVNVDRKLNGSVIDIVLSELRQRLNLIFLINTCGGSRWYFENAEKAAQIIHDNGGKVFAFGRDQICSVGAEIFGLADEKYCLDKSRGLWHVGSDLEMWDISDIENMSDDEIHRLILIAKPSRSVLSGEAAQKEMRHIKTYFDNNVVQGSQVSNMVHEWIDSNTDLMFSGKQLKEAGVVTQSFEDFKALRDKFLNVTGLSGRTLRRHKVLASFFESMNLGNLLNMIKSNL
ncbi:MAG: hypothetical protein WC755_08895 [Candidatus Woesearchaeota archaeon]|jgi:hypothetical protein